MTSFATHDALAEVVQDTAVHLAPQLISLRLAGDGSLFLADDGAPSPRARPRRPRRRAAALRRARSLPARRSAHALHVQRRQRRRDARPGARGPAPGARRRDHRRARREAAGDAGGLPVRRADGSLAIAEAFRVPEGFPHDSFPLFNTNTLWIDLTALEAPAEFTWCVARKRVDGREAIQSSGSSASSRGGTRRAMSTSRATVPPPASCPSRTRTTSPPRRTRSRRSAASAWRSTSSGRAGRCIAVPLCARDGPERNLFGSCEQAGCAPGVRDHATVTSLRTSLSLALAAVFAVPAAAGAAVTATTISEPATDPSVLVYTEPAGTTLKVSGTSNGGVARLDLRCEGAAAPIVETTCARRPPGPGRSRSRQRR